MFTTKKNLIAAALAAGLLAAPHANALEITFDFDPADFAGAEGAAALAGFEEAAGFWESLFTDAVTVDMDIGYAALDPGVLAQAGSNSMGYFYDDVRAAMLGDVTSADDAMATSNLGCDDQGAGVCTMRFWDQEGTAASFTSQLDADGSNDNIFMDLNEANAKALGLTEDQAVFGSFADADAALTFSSEFDFDFDRTDGIDADKFDFVGIAIHEIGHALGFVSGVDIVDFVFGVLNTGADDPFNLDQFAIYNTLDLFRYTDESAADGAFDGRFGADSYFSIDGGATNLADFSTGAFLGDGRQASHWKDNLGLGVMDPTFSLGEFGDVTFLDIQAFDVIGWDLAAPVSEPGVLALFGLGMFSLMLRRQKKVHV